MSKGITFPLPMKKGFGATDRVDQWWKGPAAMSAYLGIMILYATWRGFMEADFWIFSDSVSYTHLTLPTNREV